MSCPRFAPALAGIALCSVLVAGCGTDRVPSQSGARDDVHDRLVAQGIAAADAGSVADCISRGLFESGDFSKDERNATLRATDGDPPDPQLRANVEGLVRGCADDAGVEVPDPDFLAQQGGDETTSSSTQG